MPFAASRRPIQSSFCCFLLPAHGRRAAVYLEPEIVLVTGAHLPDVHRPTRTAFEPDEDRGQILALNAELFSVFIGSSLPAGALAKVGESFPVLRRFEPRGHHCVEIREHRFDGAADDVLNQIAPVRSDIANRRALAALLGLEAP